MHYLLILVAKHLSYGRGGEEGGGGGGKVGETTNQNCEESGLPYVNFRITADDKN